MGRFVTELVDQLPVLKRRRGERGDAGEPLLEIAIGPQTPRVVCDRHGQDAQEDVPRDDRHDDQRHLSEPSHQLPHERVLGAMVEEIRRRHGDHLGQVRRVDGTNLESAQVIVVPRRVPGRVEQPKVLFQVVP